MLQKKFLIHLNLFVLVSLICQLAVANPSNCAELAVIEKAEGKFQFTPANSTFPLRQVTLPQSMCLGDQVQTLNQAQLLIKHADGELVLAADSRLELTATAQVRLAEGTALFKIYQRQGTKFIAQTPLIVIGVKGTEFLLSSQAEREDIALFSGAVEVARQDEQPMAYFEAKPVAAMSFQEFQVYQNRAFSDYKSSLQQAFSDYKQQQMAEFKAYVTQVNLTGGHQLTVNTNAAAPEAIEAPIIPALEQLERQLSAWLN